MGSSAASAGEDDDTDEPGPARKVVETPAQLLGGGLACPRRRRKQQLHEPCRVHDFAALLLPWPFTLDCASRAVRVVARGCGTPSRAGALADCPHAQWHADAARGSVVVVGGDLTVLGARSPMSRFVKLSLLVRPGYLTLRRYGASAL